MKIPFELGEEDKMKQEESEDLGIREIEEDIEIEESSKEEDSPVWFEFIKTASEFEIIKKFSKEVDGILKKYKIDKSKNCCIFLFDKNGSIMDFDLNRIYSALLDLNSEHDKDVLLFLLSNGGSIEPAYQISKICKIFAKEKFIVAIPRQAKSAATLISIGADEIHIGALGQLGPIDPQLGGLPALGVVQALQTLASLAAKFPGSSEMFARYLRMALTVEQIGYCERISESAVQYAERLLSKKPNLEVKASEAARELVYEYKHHGFVIDSDEAKLHLGSNWIFNESTALSCAEEIYNLFEDVNLFLNFYKQKKLLIIGKHYDNDVMIFENKE